jgi:hypothetical protein
VRTAAPGLEGEALSHGRIAVTTQSRVAALMSDAHFSVDGTLIQAWASHKSFQPKSDDDTPPPAGPSDGSSGEMIPRNAERN